MKHYMYDYDDGTELKEFCCAAANRAEADELALAHYPQILDNLVELTEDGEVLFECGGEPDVYDYLRSANTVCVDVQAWVKRTEGLYGKR